MWFQAVPLSAFFYYITKNVGMQKSDSPNWLLRCNQIDFVRNVQVMELELFILHVLKIYSSSFQYIQSFELTRRDTRFQ